LFKGKVKMKRFSTLFIIIFLLLLTGCNKKQDVTNNSDSSNPIDELSSTYSQLVDVTYQTMRKQLNYAFVPHITYQQNNQTRDSNGYYQVDLEAQKNGVIYSYSSYSGGKNMISTDCTYYRVTEDVTTVFNPNIVINKIEYKEDTQNTISFMNAEGVIQKLLKLEYIELLNNYSDIVFNREDENGYMVLTLKNENYKVLEHPLVNTLSEKHTSLHTRDLSILYQDLSYNVYIDPQSNFLTKIEVELTPDFSVTYSFMQFGEFDLNIPAGLNFYEIADEETKEEFNALWNHVNTNLNEASSFTLREKFELVEKRGNQSSEWFNELKIDAMEDVIYFSLNAKGMQTKYYMSLEEDGIYQYFEADERIIKTKLTDDWLIEENDEFIIPIKDEIIRREGIFTENGSNFIKYSYKLTAEEFFTSDSIVYAIIENYQNKETPSLDDVYVKVELIIDLDNQTLSRIVFDTEKLMKAIYNPGFYSVSTSKLTIYFENLNSVEIETDFMETAILDKDLNLIPTDESMVVQPLVIEEANSISMEYQDDTDVFFVQFTKPGKYIIHHDYESVLLTQIVLDEQIQMQTISNQFALQILEDGPREFYFALTHYSGEIGTFNYHIETVTEDDYSDFYHDEIVYPIGRLMNKNTVSGNIDYTGDFDVFIIPNNVYLELTLSSEQALDLVVMGNIELHHITSNETLKSYLNETGLTHLYIAVFSREKEMGAYTLDYTYEDESNVDQINLGETINGAIQFENDSDKYQFTVNKNGKYLIEIGKDLEVDLSISFYDAQGRYVGSYEFFNDHLTNQTLNLEEGTYTIHIKPYFRIIGRYQFTIQSVEDDYADTLTEEGYQLGSFTGEETIKASINYNGDQDLFIPAFETNDYYIIRFDPNTNVDFCISTYCEVITPINGIQEFLYSMDHPYASLPYFKVYSDQYLGDYTIRMTPYLEEDDVTDAIDSDRFEQISLTEQTRFVSMGVDDHDIYQIIIAENGYYDFKILHAFYGYRLQTSISIYNELKELMDSYPNGSPIYLEAGTYYVLISTYAVGILALETNLLADDNINGVTIEFDASNNRYTKEGSIDFPTDQDEFSFTIVEKDYYEFYLNSNLTTTIYDSVGSVVAKYEANRYYNAKLVYLFPGHYTIKVEGDYEKIKSYTVSIRKVNSQATDDYWYDHRLGTAYTGELVLGTNSISINNSADLDVYHINIATAGHYQIHTTLDVKIHDQNNGQISITELNQVWLEEGDYYFYLSGTEIKEHAFEVKFII
jgi:uncharacterized protein YcfL